MIKLSHYILWISIVLFACKCGVNSQYRINSQKSNPANIIFLNYKASKNDLGEIKIALVNKIIVKGKIKDKSIKIDENIIGNLECIQADNRLKSIKTMYVKNPLNKTVEYVNDNGELEKKQIKLDSAQFSIRMQLDPKARFILIRGIGQAYKKNLLLSKIEI